MRILRTIILSLASADLSSKLVAGISLRRDPVGSARPIIDPILITTSNQPYGSSSTILTFFVDTQTEIRLVLERNRDLLHGDAVIRYLSTDEEREHLERISQDHGVFKGHSFIRQHGRKAWSDAGWARIIIHQTGDNPVFEGVFTTNYEHHHIQTSNNYVRARALTGANAIQSSDGSMVVWKDSDLQESSLAHDKAGRQGHPGAMCRSDDLASLINDFHSTENTIVNDQDKDPILDPLLRRQGSNPYGPGLELISSIGSTDGCPQTARIALVGIATDCSYMRSFDSPVMARSNIIQQVNSASQVYESTFNISLQIQNITMSDANCPTTASTSEPWNVDCSSDITLSDRLELFSRWRRRITDDNAFWTLLSTCSTGSQVGLSWLGQVCRQGSRGGSDGTVASANVVIRTPVEWLVIAHEVGHIFGAVHDCTLDTCSTQQCCPLSRSTCDATGQYIMNPSTGQGISQFSPCSVGNICSFIGDGTVDDSCLIENTNATTTPSAQCGNGIVEPGEECDCGGDLCGDNPCCNPTTCMFTTNSVCDFATDECCTEQCQISGSTECQNDGTCQNGDCDESDDPSDPDESRISAPGWFENNRTWIIAVASSVGGLVVLAILICCVWRCRRRKAISISNPPAFYSPRGRGQEALPPYVAAPATHQRLARYA